MHLHSWLPRNGSIFVNPLPGPDPKKEDSNIKEDPCPLGTLRAEGSPVAESPASGPAREQEKVVDDRADARDGLSAVLSLLRMPGAG